MALRVGKRSVAHLAWAASSGRTILGSQCQRRPALFEPVRSMPFMRYLPWYYRSAPSL